MYGRIKQQSTGEGRYGAAEVSLFAPGAHLFLDPSQATWIEIELVDEDGNPVPGEAYEVKLPSGQVARGNLGSDGKKRINYIPPGNCEVAFPELDLEAWEKA